MKSDLDHLMAEHNLDAIVAAGPISDPAIAYLTGGADVGHVIVVKRRGETGAIVASSIEREGAARSGLAVHLFDDELYQSTFRQTGSYTQAWLSVYLKSLDTLGASRGRVVMDGQLEFASIYLMIDKLKETYPQLEIVVNIEPPLLAQVRATKDEAELARLLDVGRRTSAVMNATRDHIQGHRLNGEAFVKADGSPLTVGDVKRFVRAKLLEHDLETPEGLILTPGVEATVPHNSGEPETPLRLGVPIVFDLFPREINGYFHDVTRTWCFGYAPDPVLAMYDDVRGCFEHVKAAARPGLSGHAMQHAASDYLRARGHPVSVDNPANLEGYLAALGHGVGLQIHEMPYLGDGDPMRLAPGHVFTLEPGLYYPERQAGMRIEDTVYLDAEGQCISITDVPYDLVIPVN